MKPSHDGPGPVLLFDGSCGLCRRVVRLLLRMDREGRLRFATLQGGAGQDYLRAHGLPAHDFDSLVYVPDWARRDRPEYRLRTDGVIAALQDVGGWGSALAAPLRLLPAGLRDAGYRLVARWRYRLFGPWKGDALPGPQWAGRFLETLE